MKRPTPEQLPPRPEAVSAIWAPHPLTWCGVCNGSEPAGDEVEEVDTDTADSVSTEGRCSSCGGRLMSDGVGDADVCTRCGDEWPL